MSRTCYIMLLHRPSFTVLSLGGSINVSCMAFGLVK